MATRILPDELGHAVVSRPPVVVAELGRAETPEETAARKAADRRKRRAQQTTRNLVASLAACLLLVLGIVLFVPRGAAPTALPSVNVTKAAAAGQGSESAPLLAPAVPASWRPNAAEMRSTGRVQVWYVGYVLPDNTFAAFSQGFDADASWLDSVLEQAKPTGATELAGHRWVVYDQRSLGSAAGNVAYALATTIGHSTIAVYGTAPTASLERLATALATEAARASAATTSSTPTSTSTPGSSG